MTGDVEAILETGAAIAVEAAASALAERGTVTGTCANCKKPLLGPYCAVCGQPSVTGRRSVHALIYAFVKDVINFDSRIMRTARALLFQPGELPKAFREGRTQPYVPAIRLYLFVSLIFFVLLSVTGIAIVQVVVTATPIKIVWNAKGNAFYPNPAYDADVAKDPDLKNVIPRLIPIDKVKALRPGGHFSFSTQAYFFARIGAYRTTLTPEQRQRLLEMPNIQFDGKVKATAARLQRNVDDMMAKLAADPAALNEPLTTWIPRAVFLLLPLYALILALFHIRRRKDFYLVDHVVFSFSIHTFAFVALILAAALAQAVPGEWVAWLLFGVVSLYIFLAMKRFYEQGWFKTTLKFVLISGIYTIFCLAPAMLVVFLLSMFGGSLG